MVRYLNQENMGQSLHVWLDSLHHFSFAGYYNPQNINFGILRVVNDDLVEPGTGFDTHPHENMEIISYVIDGALTHADSMGNERTLTRGQVQYMSAGKGVTHSEHNKGYRMLRFLQIWIIPDQKGYTPSYGDVAFDFGERVDRWLSIATYGDNPRSGAPIHLHADANIYATMLSAGKSLQFKVDPGRQAYLVLMEGAAQVGDVFLEARDALEIAEEDITLQAMRDAHALVIEMPKA